MTTLHIENTVHDYDAWKARLRQVRPGPARPRRPLLPGLPAPQDDGQVLVDLEFDNVTRAEEFREFLAGVWRTPQSQGVLAEHPEPVVLEVLEDVVVA